METSMSYEKKRYTANLELSPRAQIEAARIERDIKRFDSELLTEQRRIVRLFARSPLWKTRGEVMERPIESEGTTLPVLLFLAIKRVRSYNQIDSVTPLRGRDAQNCTTEGYLSMTGKLFFNEYRFPTSDDRPLRAPDDFWQDKGLLRRAEDLDSIRQVQRPDMTIITLDQRF